MGNSEKPLRIAVLMACHNRRAKTERCIRSLQRQKTAFNVELQYYVLDDGSVDGTDEAVRNLIPDVHLVYSDGDLYWNRSMRKLMIRANVRGFDFLWCVNDDVEFYDDAIDKLMSSFASLTNRQSPQPERPGIVSGAMIDPNTREMSYGGLVRDKYKLPPSMKKISPDDFAIRPCDTINMNSAVISKATIERIGILRHAFRQKWGDLDYGLRARQSGVPVGLSPGFVGECEINKYRTSVHRKRLGLGPSLKYFLSSFDRAPWQRSVYLREHGGPFWALIWISPYFMFWVRYALRIFEKP